MEDHTRLSLSLNSLRELKHPEELDQALSQICTLFGLTHMTFLVVRTGISSVSHPFYCSTYPRDWVQTYLACGYFDIDPVIDIIRTGFLPVDWSTLPQRSPEAVRFFEEAQCHGIGPNGLTIPVRGANGERCLFSVTSDVSKAQWSSLCMSSVHDLHVLSHYLHEKVLALTGLREAARYRDLSRRERQCLQLLAKGKIYKQIAAALGISEISVRLHIRSARGKLGAQTSHQAVAKASFLELINF